MSRVGKQPIAVPDGVTVAIDSGVVTVNGPKGSLSQPSFNGINIDQSEGNLSVSRIDDERQNRARHGLMRTLFSNMVDGVTKGFEKKLEINGVGYRVSQQGSELKFNLGFSHDVIYKIPEG